MTPNHKIPSDIAFTPSVKAIQSRKGSRNAYSRMEASDGWKTTISSELAAFIAKQSSFFIATANAAGQPYIQHRGGPPGFLKVLDESTLAFADFNGNRQYITAGNLQDNPKVHLFLIDYSTQQRVKVWGTAMIVENEPELINRLMPQDYKARSEQAILIRVDTWDANCPQHILQRFEAADVAIALETKDRLIRKLEDDIVLLSSATRT